MPRPSGGRARDWWLAGRSRARGRVAWLGGRGARDGWRGTAARERGTGGVARRPGNEGRVAWHGGPGAGAGAGWRDGRPVAGPAAGESGARAPGTRNSGCRGPRESL